MTAGRYPPDPMTGAGLAIIVAAHNEAGRIEASLAALSEAFPGAALWVADDASEDGTAEIARAAGAAVVTRERSVGKGGNVTEAARAALANRARPSLVLLCDGDLGASTAKLAPLVELVREGDCDLAIAAFSTRVGGGFGLALGFARWAIQRRSGYRAEAAISGQRAMRPEVLERTLPFAPGYGMEIGLTVDAVRAGFRVAELELDLEHRATGRTLSGFLHRARQLRDFARVWWARR